MTDLSSVHKLIKEARKVVHKTPNYLPAIDKQVALIERLADACEYLLKSVEKETERD